MDTLSEARNLIRHLNECLALMEDATRRGDTETIRLFTEIAGKYTEAAENIMEEGNKERDTGEVTDFQKQET
jgi:hypothetical protein